MKKCWETQPQDRPSFAELVKMLNKLLQTPKDRPPAPPPRTETPSAGTHILYLIKPLAPLPRTGIPTSGSGKQGTKFSRKISITNSDLNRPCFAWRPYGKSGLFKTELVIIVVTL